MYKIKRFNCTWNEYKQFSEGDEERAEARKGKKLENSHRGLGRSLILGGGLPGALGAYATKGKVDEDYSAGKSEEEIVSNAGKRGAKYGAAIGAGAGAVGGLANYALGAKAANELKSIGAIDNTAAKAIKGGIIKNAAKGALISAALGTLGAHLGAKKNAKERLNKRTVNRE